MHLHDLLRHLFTSTRGILEALTAHKLTVCHFVCLCCSHVTTMHYFHILFIIQMVRRLWPAQLLRCWKLELNDRPLQK